MGAARGSFTRLISPCRNQWSEVLYRVVPAHKQHLCQKKGIAKKLIQTFRAIMISQEVDLVAGDFNPISVLLMKSFLIVPCLRHRAPHHCGYPGPFRTTGQTFVDFSSHTALSVSGK